MADTAGDPADDSAALAPRARRNPYFTVLAILAGFAWTLAIMLWIVLAQVTDYTTYDVDEAAALNAWIDALVVTGIATTVGMVVVAGVRRELRSASP
ncbi:hypothetical protein GCM10027413_29120 [Conyzicola nivalis]|uniref:Uncharacterized protein n=1 Tax=Conyzicola nivalis TaxID=1477021 RepID=A0A916SUE3_9MICO|nr:hypothetical protein [Conyzicola nivalis]GGB13855.1 hypothetical protein GCM10010979_30390 [Conyzicola nivalis]